MDKINEQLQKMTLKEKLGQLMVVGFPSSYYDEHIRTLVEDYKVGNVIIFSRNFENVNQIKTLNEKITEEIIKHTGIIPFISVDQEGGNVVRIDTGATYPPSAMSTAASYDGAPYDTGRIIGDDLIKLGFNVNLAPVVDINTNIDNPSSNIRTYGDDKYKVAKCGEEYLKGLKEFGVIGCLKHYPSYGACSVDSHLELPYNDQSFEELDEFYMFPYYKIKNAEMIMTAHVIYNNIDKDYPGSISKASYDILRNKIGYQGLTITDCLEMNAIVDKYTTEGGAVLALQAGADLLCICHTLERQIGALKNIEKAINDGKISIEEIDEKVKRILVVKAEVARAKALYYNKNELNLNQESKMIAQNIVDKSLTKIKGELKFDNKTLVVAPTSMNFSNVEDNKNSKNIANFIKEEFPSVDVIPFSIDLKNEFNDQLNNYDRILFFTYVGPNTRWEIDMINEISKIKEVEVISLRGPFDYHLYDDVKSYYCLYEYTDASIKTIIKFLQKKLKPEGHLPIKY